MTRFHTNRNTYLCGVIDLAELVDEMQHGHISQHVVPLAVVIKDVL
jgi:hypothetical protein